MDLVGYAHSTRWIKSVLNATAFSQNLSLLITVIKDGNDHMFYYPLLIMLSVALTLQVGVALTIVWYSFQPLHKLAPAEASDHLKRFNRILMMLTTVSLMLNIAVNVIFSARVGKLQLQAGTKSEL